MYASEILISANDSTHSNFDWNFSGYTANKKYNNPSTQVENFVFKNAKTFEAKTNFEGSIQITYTLKSLPENDWYLMKSEACLDFCEQTISKEILAAIEYNVDGEKRTINSNFLKFDYYRYYSHPWTKSPINLTKQATSLPNVDNLSLSEDYYWVKYVFCHDNARASNENTTNQSNCFYPYQGVYIGDIKVVDILPKECLVYNTKGELIEPIDDNGTYNFTYANSYTGYDSIYKKYSFSAIVGYPKSIYNEENNNLEITNTASEYGIYAKETDYTYFGDSSVTINLANFKFTYDGDLYSISKNIDMNNYVSPSKLYYQSIIENDESYSKAKWYMPVTAIYTGTPMTVKVGDDLLYATNTSGTFSKLEDDEYYFTEIYKPTLGNANKDVISQNYTCELWVRKANQSEYTLNTSFVNTSSTQTFTFTKEDQVVGWYILIKDMNESIVPIITTSGTWYRFHTTICFNKKDIPQEGEIHNFNYIQVYHKDSNNNLILQNQPNLDSYSTLMTELEIATHDQNTYGIYLQRATASNSWTLFTNVDMPKKLCVSKKASAIIQDKENEEFTGNFTIFGGVHVRVLDSLFTSFKTDFLNNESNYVKGFTSYDLLPKGMVLTSSIEELYEDLFVKYYDTHTHSLYSDTAYYTNVYNAEGILLTYNEISEILIESTTITVTENYNGTGRTRIDVITDLANNPLIITTKSNGTTQHFYGVGTSYKYTISYDSYYEYGSVYKNPLTINHLYPDSNCSDEISTEETVTIKSVSATHQDVTTYVQTNLSNYSTGVVDTSCDSEYEYKLRVRTGIADVTNLIIYSNIEEAQQGRSRWKGEFIGTDTSYAENKGFVVKQYYSENPTVGNLYNEDGSLNSDWKEFFEHQEEILSNGLAITFNSQSKTESNCDYVIIYYEKDGNVYQTQKLMGTDIAGKTVTIPSTDFYLYWYTDGSVCSNYGFSIDSIVPGYVEDITDTTGSIPSYAVTELQDNNYPDSAFDSYTHGNYGNNLRKLWHYTYTGEPEILQPFVQGTDTSKVKSLAFEYLDNEGNPAILPVNSFTYVLIKMKSPADESIKTLARMDCRTQWTALDDLGNPVDFITGINSNVVKVALPNSVKTDDMPSVSLRFTKEIQGTDFEFKNMKLDKADLQTFIIRLTSLTANDDETYNQVTGLLSSTKGLIITQIPVGTYLLEELGDNYFDFVEFTDNNDSEIIIEGVTFEKTDQGYIITVSEDLTENIEFNIKVTNEIENERFYEDKDNKENLFLKNKIEENS